jgi:hypothetical protein
MATESELDALNREEMTLNRKAGDEQELACIEAIRRIHAAEPTIKLGRYRTWRRRVGMGWLSDNVPIPKYSPSGEYFLGWYRQDQTRGRPSRVTPLKKAVLNAFQPYAAIERKSIDAKVLATQLGRQSGVARRKKGLDTQIRAYLAQLSATNMPAHQHVKVIARGLHCSCEYVRRIRRRVMRQKNTQKENKNTT